MDEPEAALSPQRQLSFLILLHDLVKANDNIQFIIATHSPGSARQRCANANPLALGRGVRRYSGLITSPSISPITLATAKR